MTILWILSYLVILLYILLGLFCLSAGLLYITELVEESTVTTGKVIRYLILSEFLVQIMFLFTDYLTFSTVAMGIIAHLFYWSLLKHFPAFHFASFEFIGSLFAFALHHVVAFHTIVGTHHSFCEVLAYFTFILWAVPFLYLISLSANDLVLPQTVQPFSTPGGGGGNEREPLLGSDQDMISSYLKQKRRSLYSVLSAARDCLPVLKSKKGF